MSPLLSPPVDPPPFLGFWGKAQPSDAPPYPRSHPVAYHLLDVAASVEAILVVRPLALQRGSALLGLSPEEAKTVLVTLAGLHDLGKFAPFFQMKESHLAQAEVRQLKDSQVLPGVHTRDGLGLWREELAAWVPARVWTGGDTALDALAPAVFGHHGRPVDAGRFDVLQRFRTVGADAARACAEAVVSLLCPVPVDAAPASEERARVASWWVAGLVTVADWVGSSQQWFPYTEPLSDDPTLAGYWGFARHRAAAAVREAGLVVPPSAGRRTFHELTGIEREPSPVQCWAETAPLPSSPTLVIVEDVTGAGKTEAAQVLVHRWMSEGRVGGAYWAMPTQATANAMYGRQARMLGQLFADEGGAQPSLVLAHGQQRLHQRFRYTVLDGVASPRAAAEDAGDDELPASVSCAAFLADDRRAALLADVGAGTIDQALLGVLSSRFGPVRLFGVADHALVVDEAHAYDAYMRTELRTLLSFQAALGGCAVVLSATLSEHQRAALVDAWREGCAAAGPFVPRGRLRVELASAEYPLVTVVSGDAAREEDCDAAPWSARDVAVRIVHTLEDAVQHVQEAAAGDGAVVWIRNTVNDCLEAAALLRGRGIDRLLVFHARFAQCDRQAREQEVLRRFGKDARPSERAGWVLVATQVVEQSLDLDFDAMVSDVAPIDLLIQRAGRLWRHDRARPPGCEREMVVLAPEPDDVSKEGWTKGLFAGTAAVYEHAGVLWRTVQELRREGGIRTPEGLRPLIEAVYGADAAEPPLQLSEIAQRAEGKEAGQAAAAQYGVLKLPDGYCANQMAWVNDVLARTRLGDEQTPVRLARIGAGGSLVPWCRGEPGWMAWARSEVRVSAHQVPLDAAEPPEHAAAAQVVRSTWGRFDQGTAVLVLAEDADAGAWSGRLLRTDGKAVQIGYTEAEGLAFLAT